MEVKSCRLKTGICLIVGHIFLDYLTIICIEKMQNNIQGDKKSTHEVFYGEISDRNAVKLIVWKIYLKYNIKPTTAVSFSHSLSN